MIGVRGYRSTSIGGLRRLVAIGLVGLASCLSLVGCWSGGEAPIYSYWVLNDSDDELIIDVRELLHQTWGIAPHSYGGVLEFRGAPRSDWTIEIVDEDCVALSTWPVDTVHDLLYVGPSGNAEFKSGYPWSAGLDTAKQAAPVLRTPSCP
jgi:hypothetical protein